MNKPSESKTIKNPFNVCYKRQEDKTWTTVTHGEWFGLKGQLGVLEDLMEFTNIECLEVKIIRALFTKEMKK